jgi:hypothetical protein
MRTLDRLVVVGRVCHISENLSFGPTLLLWSTPIVRQDGNWDYSLEELSLNRALHQSNMSAFYPIEVDAKLDWRKYGF